MNKDRGSIPASLYDTEQAMSASLISGASMNKAWMRTALTLDGFATAPGPAGTIVAATHLVPRASGVFVVGYAFGTTAGGADTIGAYLATYTGGGVVAGGLVTNDIHYRQGSNVTVSGALSPVASGTSLIVVGGLSQIALNSSGQVFLADATSAIALIVYSGAGPTALTNVLLSMYAFELA